MSRQRWIILGAVVLVLVAIGGSFLVRVQLGRNGSAGPGQEPAEGWPNFQPAEGVLNPIVEPVDPKAGWAAARPSPMTACCLGQGAGRRTRRTYPMLLGSPDCQSLIRGTVSMGGSVG